MKPFCCQLSFSCLQRSTTGSSRRPIALIGFIALVEVCGFGHIASTHYLWTAPAWLGWYAYATWIKGTNNEPNGIVGTS